MKKRPAGLLGIAYCYFSLHMRDGRRAFQWHRVAVYGAVPILIGVLLAIKLGTPDKDKLTLIVAVLSVLAAVLVGLLPLAHSILAQTEVRDRYTEGERPIAQQELDRVQVLQDLHAAISWAVIVLVFGLAICAVIGLATSAAGWIQAALRGGLYFVMASTALTFFDVSQVVFESMEHHAKTLKERIESSMVASRRDDADKKDE